MTWTSRDYDGDTVYCIEDQDTDEIIDLPRHGKLLICNEGITVYFAVLDWQSGQSSDGTPDTYRMVFHGSGPSAGLRECRHTWWGEPDNAGYIFYPTFDVIEAALRELRRWFEG